MAEAVGTLGLVDAERILKSYREWVDRRLDELLPAADSMPANLHQAMRYSCLAPGKRLRPVLCMASAKSVGGNPLYAIDAGAALEMIHVFSLIHDDLPAIDDDNLRRGRPTCHVQYGEGLAILAGDALFSLGFQVLGAVPVDADRRLGALKHLAIAAGSSGLVGGEVLDIEAEGKEIDAATLATIHERKTGALIAASCAIGGLVGGGSEEQVHSLWEYGMHVGLAFQIIDDVLNVVGTPEQLGKAAGSDSDRKKATYPAMFGLEESRQKARSEVETGVNKLGEIVPNQQELRALAEYAIERMH